MERVEVGGLDIAYERVGSGSPVVLLHGYVGDGPSLWRRQLDGLSDEFTVVAWDAPGAGVSSDPPGNFGMRGYADCLAAFIDAVGLDAPHVVGLSFGGALALALYRRHRGLAKTLVLASAYAGWRGSLPDDVANARLEQAERLAKVSTDEFVETLLPTMFASEVAATDVDAFRTGMISCHPGGFLAMARAAAVDLRAVPPTVTIPTLLIYGDRDERAPRAAADAIHAAIGQSRLVMLEGVGHLCNVEAPDDFNHEVRSFLRANEDRATGMNDGDIV